MATSTFILETSYEIIHKVGGVETVVRSKAPELVEIYQNRFFMIGMYLPQDDRYATNFEDRRTGYFDTFLLKFESLFGLAQGSVKYGTWLIPGQPQCFLLPLDFNSSLTNYTKRAIYEDIGLEAPGPQGAENFKQNAISFGAMQWAFYCYFLAEYCKNNEKVVIQTHEWLAAVGLVMTKKRGNVFTAMQCAGGYHQLDVSRLKFTFTTHATTLGRHLSAGDADLNKCFACKEGGVWDREASKRQILFEHRIERAAAGLSDAFTTVSIITSQECEAFLGRYVDAVTWNGLHVDSQRGLIDDHELNYKHMNERAKIMEFVRGHFFGIDIDNTFVFFSAGRYEYKNKGYDLFVDALYEVNKKLKSQLYIEANPELKNKFVVGIIIAPAENNGFTEHSLYITNLVKEIEQSVDTISESIIQNFSDAICSPQGEKFENLKLKDVATSQDIMYLKRFHQSMRKSANQSPVTTHKVVKQDCELLSRLRELNMLNYVDDKCKIVWVPEFLSKTSIFGIDYPDFTRGADLGIFASLYEPFGYTSPECMCVGTASIVSNMCGFGNYIEKLIDKQAEKQHPNSWIAGYYGVQVVDRIFKSYWDTVLQLHDMMLDYLKLNSHQQIALRNKMARGSVVVDWSVVIKEYISVYDKIAGCITTAQ